MDGSTQIARGLKLVYIGFLITSFDAFVYILLPLSGIDFLQIHIFMDWTFWIASVISLIGKLVCLQSPDRVGAKIWVRWSLAFGVVAFLMSFGFSQGWFSEWLADEKTRYPLIYARWMISAIGYFLFLVYLRCLANFVDHDHLQRKIGRAVWWYRLELFKVAFFFSLTLLAAYAGQTWAIDFLNQIRNPRLLLNLFGAVDLVERLAQFAVFFSITLLIISVVAYSRLLNGVRSAVLLSSGSNW